MNTTELIKTGSEILKKNNISSYSLDSEIILSNILKITREKLLIYEDKVTNKIVKKFKKLIIRRSLKEPIAYIIKNKEFMSKSFYVDNKSLIPRPETELLIQEIIKIYRNKRLFFLDIGVGSGCIMLSILKNLNKSTGIGIDISKSTLINSKKNLKKFKLLNRSKLLQKSINEMRNIKFDLIVSNPPYVVRRDIKRLSNDVKKFEPIIALDGGNDGLDVIKKVIYKAKYILKSNGILALEIGKDQYRLVTKVLEANNFREKIVIKDYKNNIRCIFSTLLN
tara:strand:+ start:1582 stop:2421 length:840 start_codon:yes stop_codon:yes gene_type:complete